MIREPDAPRGCPRAMAPPLVFVLSRMRPSSFSTERYWAANASFTWGRRGGGEGRGGEGRGGEGRGGEGRGGEGRGGEGRGGGGRERERGREGEGEGEEGKGRGKEERGGVITDNGINFNLLFMIATHTSHPHTSTRPHLPPTHLH